MLLSIDVPETVVERAAELGLPLVSFVLKTLEEATRQRSIAHDSVEEAASLRRARATKSIREIAARNTLEDLCIKDLIEEGRRA